jgi:hypothetical protein
VCPQISSAHTPQGLLVFSMLSTMNPLYPQVLHHGFDQPQMENILNNKLGLDTVAHTYNPSYLGGRALEDISWRSGWAKS